MVDNNRRRSVKCYRTENGSADARCNRMAFNRKQSSPSAVNTRLEPVGAAGPFPRVPVASSQLAHRGNICSERWWVHRNIGPTVTAHVPRSFPFGPCCICMDAAMELLW